MNDALPFFTKVLKDADFDDIVISMKGTSRGMIAVEWKMKQIAELEALYRSWDKNSAEIRVR